MRSAAHQIIKLSEALATLDPDNREELANEVLKLAPNWTPLVGPQMEAYNSPADILYYGGSAGSAKSDLLLGLATTAHRRSIILRREATQTQGLIDRLTEMLGTKKGFNGQRLTWNLKNRHIQFGSCNNPGDEQKWQGQPFDLWGYDEITHFLELQFRFLMTWLRTTKEGVRSRIVCTGNPPTTQQGRWVITFWGPWLDPKHPKPAQPGELRWYTTIDGKDVEVQDGKPFRYNGELILPMSRTFIPGSVDDNPFLLRGNYKSRLQALPEPLRSQMLQGDFRAGIKDSDWQVIPTAWVEAAMARWTPEGKKGPMDSVGVDPSRGGDDNFEISSRYGWWFAPMVSYPGREITDGAIGAGKVLVARRDNAPVHVDVIGIGGSVYDHLNSNGIHVIAVNSSAKVEDWETDRMTQKMRFRNYRAKIWWRFREALDPATESGQMIALPPDPELKADLCAPQWSLTPGGILVEPKDDKIGPEGMRISGIKSRLGRSPNKGDAVVYCSISTPKRKGSPGTMPNQHNIAKSYAVKFDPEGKRRY